jgi:isopropylmalate/homocitrate/citramalate synthase
MEIKYPEQQVHKQSIEKKSFFKKLKEKFTPTPEELERKREIMQRKREIMDKKRKAYIENLKYRAEVERKKAQIRSSMQKGKSKGTGGFFSIPLEPLVYGTKKRVKSKLLKKQKPRQQNNQDEFNRLIWDS